MDLAVEMVRNGDLGAPVPDYVDENVSDKVVRIVQSYVGVVNKMVWRKGWGTRCCLVRYPLRVLTKTALATSTTGGAAV